MSIGRINQNVMAFNSYKNLTHIHASLNNNIKHFSTGLRVENSSDDPTGIAISERFRSQITGYEIANKNAQNADNLLQVADGALNESHNILQRLRQLALISANDATTMADRNNMQTEVNQLLEELDTIALTTQYNGRKLLDGSLAGSRERKGSNIAITSNAYVNLTIAQRLDNSNTLIKNAFITDVLSNTVDTYGGQDFSLEIKLHSRLLGRRVSAVAYMSSSVDPVTGLNPPVMEKDITNTFPFQTETMVLQLDNNHWLNIEFNEASPRDDPGKKAFLKITGQQNTISIDRSVSFQIGSNQGTGIALSINDMTSGGLRIQNLDITNRLSGQNAIGMVDEAINKLSSQRVGIGAMQKRIEHIISSNEGNIINQKSAESRIRDVDFARETLSYTRNSILISSGNAILGQANSSVSALLKLLNL